MEEQDLQSEGRAGEGVIARSFPRCRKGQSVKIRASAAAPFINYMGTSLIPPCSIHLCALLLLEASVNF